MGDTQPSEVEPPMPTAEEMKVRTCLDCGFLTIEERELSKMNRAYLSLFLSVGRSTGEYDWESPALPRDVKRISCFKGLWGYQYVGTECDEDWYEILIDEIECPRVNCPGFAPYEVGYTPKELRKRIDDDHRAQIAAEQLKKILEQIPQRPENAPPQPAQSEPPPTKLPNVFRVDGEMVHIQFAGQAVGIFDNSQGMKYLAHLISHSGQIFETPLQFYDAIIGKDPIRNKRIPADNVEDLDDFRDISYLPDDRESNTKSLKQCNDEIKIINSDLDNLDRDFNLDPLVREELEKRKDELLKIVGILSSGKSRKAELDPETAKLTNAIRQAVFRAIAQIENAANHTGSPLANHFTQALKPFSFPLSYNPQPPIRWNE